MCGCTKTAFQFSTSWMDKVIADTGDHYVFPEACTGWVDPDGHCHEGPDDQVLRSQYLSNVPKAIPKLEVRGVVA